MGNMAIQRRDYEVHCNNYIHYRYAKEGFYWKEWGRIDMVDLPEGIGGE